MESDVLSEIFVVLFALILLFVIGWFAYVEIHNDNLRTRRARIARGARARPAGDMPPRCRSCYLKLNRVGRFCPRCGNALEDSNR